MILGDAAPGVPDGDLDHFVGLPGRHQDLALFTTVFENGMDGVLHQAHQKLQEPVGCDGKRAFVGEFLRQCDPVFG
ncbi:MAG TPA: hypothetical protein PK297_03155, partial [Spirochaetota bacterium]|nr:hypothetical protein [Spirochaetota bacterium]